MPIVERPSLFIRGYTTKKPTKNDNVCNINIAYVLLETSYKPNGLKYENAKQINQ